MDRATLYIVSTPIGNMEDITLRALRILKEVDLIAAEDTRVTRKLLSHYDIHTSLTSYHERNKVTKVDYLIGLLKQGRSIALTSNAGTPGISDPGYCLIRDVVRNNIPVVSIPGPSAVISALVSSGLPTNGFVFIGFLPRKKGKIKRLLEESASLKKTVVMYESPYRILKTLEMVKDILGDPEVVIAREMTKKFEEMIRGTAGEVLDRFKGRAVKGEVILMVDSQRFS